MNKQNLKPNTERTPSERKELARKAGQASGAARRKRKDIRTALETLLSKKLDDIENPGHKIEGVEKIAYTLFQRAILGDVKSIKLILEITGEYVEGQKIDINAEVKPERKELSVAEAKAFLAGLYEEYGL